MSLQLTSLLYQKHNLNRIFRLLIYYQNFSILFLFIFRFYIIIELLYIIIVIIIYYLLYCYIIKYKYYIIKSKYYIINYKYYIIKNILLYNKILQKIILFTSIVENNINKTSR